MKTFNGTIIMQYNRAQELLINIITAQYIILSLKRLASSPPIFIQMPIRKVTIIIIIIIIANSIKHKEHFYLTFSCPSRVKFGVLDPNCHTWLRQNINMHQLTEHFIWLFVLHMIVKSYRLPYLNSSIKRSTGKLVVVLGVNDYLHNVMCVAFKHLRALPFLIPVPQFDQHVI